MYSLRILDSNSCGEVGPREDVVVDSPTARADDDDEADGEFWEIMELVNDVKDETIPLIRDADDW